jgi:WW domain-containing oxidoreductase
MPVLTKAANTQEWENKMTSASIEVFDFESTAEEVTEGLDLRGTWWLITGCNSGLGYETMRVLSLRGASVIGAARSEEKAQKALDELGVNGLAVACELSDLSSVRACVEKVKASNKPLNGIIANAGIMALQENQQKHGIELQFFTNHIGHFVLVTGLLEQLTDEGRVVILSSGAHRRANRGLELDNLSGEFEYEPWRMYGRSKLANILFARSLAKRFAEEGTKRTANSLHPGVISTNLTRQLPQDNWEKLVADINFKTVGQGAATQCLVATHPGCREISGAYFSDCQVADTTDFGKDDALAAELWKKTEEIIASIG